MRFKIYLSVGGEKFDAEAFHKRASDPEARVRVIGHRGAELHPGIIKRLNVWETPQREASNHPGVDLRALLKQYAPALAVLFENEKELIECWATIVGYYEEGEEPRGFSFDSETISMLHQIRAGIEIDIVRDLSEC